MIPVVLSGGSGTRLWPVSRTKFPKQFCNLFEQSLHSLTLNRISHFGTPWVVTSASLRDLTLKNIREVGAPDNHVILEPCAKNTAPAIALLTAHLANLGKSDDVVGIFPADHLIENEAEFRKAIALANIEAENDKVVTLGIKPNFPATGYGYIQVQGEQSNSLEDINSFSVAGFHEKPSTEKADAYLKSGQFFWNAGIFVFKVKTMMKHLETFQPELHSQLTRINADLSNIEDVYSKVQSISIDYAIMEKLSDKDLVCIPCDIGWSDVGSWDAIADILGGRPQTNVIEFNSRNNFVQSKVDKTYSFVGVDDLIVVDTADALLISKKGSTQNVKDIVDILKNSNPTLVSEHREML
ncbi:sugar phosphate nucleotidyltransferase [Bdellovibrio sp. SKB1291214]|uniref:mannose-1-phosphate guanylyltransferase n=1 Tax=Bdellovibrio sp. SKB1291214 TaxID=1732569 RepID=UPI001594E985|nr:mannose-1-phosphate guanylyltransferase [Bdellovibrio sp. SKB1291214]UYL08293.1 sugar phosphate nucleotidyltransferase [Bdellovibrio sp. SKB1291214]